MDRIWKWQSSHINSVFATYEKWVLSLNWPFITHLPYVLLEELCMSNYTIYGIQCHMCNGITYPIFRRMLGSPND